MIIKQVEGDKSKDLWPICAIMVTHMLIFFNFVIICFFFWLKLLCFGSSSVIGL